MIRIVVVGASWGGLRAVNTILEGLPPWFLPPVVIVQHRRAGPHTDLVRSFASRSTLPVLEPVDKSEILSGHVYVAPADYHLLVGRDGFALTIDEPRSFSRPSTRRRRATGRRSSAASSSPGRPIPVFR